MSSSRPSSASPVIMQKQKTAIIHQLPSAQSPPGVLSDSNARVSPSSRVARPSTAVLNVSSPSSPGGLSRTLPNAQPAKQEKKSAWGNATVVRSNSRTSLAPSTSDVLRRDIKLMCDMSEIYFSCLDVDGCLPPLPAAMLPVLSPLAPLTCQVYETQWVALLKSLLLSWNSQYGEQHKKTALLNDIWHIQLSRLCFIIHHHLSSSSIDSPKASPVTIPFASLFHSLGVLPSSGVLCFPSVTHTPVQLSLLSVLRLIQLLYNYMEECSKHSHAQHSWKDVQRQLKRDNKKLKEEIELLSTVIRDATEGRPKTQRVNIVHTHLYKGSLLDAAADRRAPNQSPSVHSDSPASHSHSSLPDTLLNTPSFEVDSTPSKLSPPHASTSTQSLTSTLINQTAHAPSEQSLLHEIKLLKQSLEAERRNNHAAHHDAQQHYYDELSSLRARVDQLTATNSSLSYELSVARDSISKSSVANAKIHEELRVHALKGKLNSTTSVEAQALRQELKAMELKHNEETLLHQKLAKDQISKAQLELSSAQALHSKLQSDYESLQHELIAVRAQLAEFESARFDSRSSELLVRQSSEEVRQAEADRLAASHARRAKFDEELAARKAELEKQMAQDKRDKFAELEHKHTDEIASYKRHLASVEAECVELRAREAERTAAWNEQRDDIKTMQVEYDKMKNALNELRAQQQHRSHKQDDSHDDHHQRVKTLEKEYADLKTKYFHLESDNKQLAQSLADTASSLSVERSTVESVRHRCAELEQQLLSAQTLYHASEMQSQHNLKQLTDLKAASEAEIAHLTDELKKLKLLVESHSSHVSSTSSVQSPSKHLKKSPSAQFKLPASPHAVNFHHTQSHSHTPTCDAFEVSQQLADYELKLAILRDQQQDVLQEQKMLEHTAQILNQECLAKLLLLLPIDHQHLQHIQQHIPSIDIEQIDTFKQQLREESETTQNLRSYLQHTIKHPPTQVSCTPLTARIEQLRRQCAFHEEKLGLAKPSQHKHNTATRAQLGDSTRIEATHMLHK